tara:strand:+ start:6385 stop:6696 length:312 start_codon:yes stop_codon:yes gene_type:complete
MENYIIEDIIDIDLNDDYAIIKFKLESDCIDEYRVLETKEYYDWCMEDYQMSNDYNIGDIHEENEDEFNFFNWEEIYKDNEYVLDFIYENYSNLSDLPEIFIE